MTSLYRGSLNRGSTVNRKFRREVLLNNVHLNGNIRISDPVSKVRVVCCTSKQTVAQASVAQ